MILSSAISTPLWLRHDGSVPTHAWFMRKLRFFFPKSIGSHSMHAGGTTSLAAAGMAADNIRAMGRWKSDAWEHYVRKNPVLLQALIFHGRSIHDSPFAPM
ncbi:hypothetical protein PAXRUDRAFT_17228 [Paxillus rubicundulus Ve08.2h10]|uniref:Ndc10 domain-containing protein n=1 Tax=Paxillus rubicundulus Ve08.2h10 TaxID=930991 RepID=A0A0D0CR60_9AGAM|nr:hypothetical protein PAXRUDRAFT_17228 [Paxillus rubicundulus Ve08.2h10]